MNLRSAIARLDSIMESNQKIIGSLERRIETLEAGLPANPAIWPAVTRVHPTRAHRLAKHKPKV